MQNAEESRGGARGAELEGFVVMGLSLGAATLIAVTALLSGAVGCASAASDGAEDETAEGALIPAQLFSAACRVSIPADDGTIGVATVSGRFRVGNDGALSAADNVPVRLMMPGGQEKTVKLRSGKVVDAENDLFELTVAFGLFSVGVRYDGAKAKGNNQNVRIDTPLKGPATYDGSCTFKDEAGGSADGKVAPST